MSNISCIACGHIAKPNGENFKCQICGLDFLGFSSHQIDYSATYSDESSLYSAHLRSLDYFHKVRSIKSRLLPFESIILEFLSTCGSPIRLVDIGCGVGRFLRGAQERLGAENVSAYEVANVLVKKLREYGLTVHNGDLQTFLDSDHTADVITLLEVIEHLRYPGEEVKKIFSLKKPTYLIIVVPASFTRRIFDKNFSAHDRPPNHLSWWNPQSLFYLLNQNGYSASTIPIAESRKSLIGHYIRNKDWFRMRSLGLLLKGLISPPIFWYLGIAKRL
jgi:SAM-dependent methyltransferase